jgi:cystatin-C
MKFQSLVLFLLVLLVSMAKNQAKPGGYTPIKDINDPHVIEIAKFAITEHNKRVKTELHFTKVISGESQVVAGINYRLTLSARYGSSSKSDPYVAVVYDRPQQHLRNLTYFIPINA